MVGGINVHEADQANGTFSYGVGVGPEHKGQGYAAEAVLLVLRFMFDERRFQKCEAKVYDYNSASIALHQKLLELGQPTGTLTVAQVIAQASLTKEEATTALTRVECTSANEVYASVTLPNLIVGTVGGGTTLPDPKRWLELMGCAGPGKVYRLAQLVAATALALEISASAAMATAGSENFFRAHFERGGMR